MTLGRFCALLIRMSATSSIGFVPTSVAAMLFVVPLRVTVMVPTVNGRGDDVIIRHDKATLRDDHSRTLVFAPLPLLR